MTRKSQWERPTEQDAEGTITMDLATPEHDKSSEGEGLEERERREENRGVGMPRTPEGSPPPTPDEEKV